MYATLTVLVAFRQYLQVVHVIIVIPRCSQNLERQVAYDWWSPGEEKSHDPHQLMDPLLRVYSWLFVVAHLRLVLFFYLYLTKHKKIIYLKDKANTRVVTILCAIVLRFDIVYLYVLHETESMGVEWSLPVVQEKELPL